MYWRSYSARQHSTGGALASPGSVATPSHLETQTGGSGVIPSHLETRTEGAVVILRLTLKHGQKIGLTQNSKTIRFFRGCSKSREIPCIVFASMADRLGPNLTLRLYLMCSHTHEWILFLCSCLKMSHVLKASTFF